jgi:hypothetical protein
MQSIDQPKGVISMTIQRGKKREHQMNADYLLEHISDGKVLDEYEFYDRMLLFRQLQLLMPLPAHKR